MRLEKVFGIAVAYSKTRDTTEVTDKQEDPMEHRNRRILITLTALAETLANLAHLGREASADIEGIQNASPSEGESFDLRLGRALRNIRHFNAEFDAFLDRLPPCRVVEAVSEAGERVPAEIEAIARMVNDGTNNLPAKRVWLDWVATQLPTASRFTAATMQQPAGHAVAVGMN